MALYTPDFIERVRNANELTQVVSSYNVQLKRASANMLGLCPFHNEKTPSFNVRPTEQYFRCFGCGAKGDVFGFVQLMEKVEFPEAVRLLAERAGIPIEFDSPEAARKAKTQGRTKSALLWCCSRAADYYVEALASSGGAVAREYLARRGFEKETIERWRLGWAPDGYEGLAGFLLKSAKDSGEKAKVLEYAVQAGLLRPRDSDGRSGRPNVSGSGADGRQYRDVFWGRVMFPIVDAQSRPIGFGGRILKEKPGVGKYINSPEGLLFSKRTVLFGLAQAAKEIALTGTAVVVEGYTDTIMCHQYGIRNVVATLGTALTPEHVSLLRRHLSGKGKVIAFFDADKAGRLATRRAIDLFMEQDVPLAVATDLELKDAGDFLPKFGAEAFRAKLSAAEDSFAFLMRETLGLARDRDPQAMSVAVREMMTTVNLCPDVVARSLMRQRVAAAAGIPEAALPEPVENTPISPALAGAKLARPGRKPGLSAAGTPASAPAATPGASGLAAAFPDVVGLTQGKMRIRLRREARLLRYMWENSEWCARIADCFPPDHWRDAALSELAALVRNDWAREVRPVLNDIRSRAAQEASGDRLAELAFPNELPLSSRDLQEVLKLVLNEDREEEIALLKAEMAKAQRTGDSVKAAELWTGIVVLKQMGNAARKKMKRSGK